MDKIRILVLAIKYWLQGDEWSFAVEYATSIIRGFKSGIIEEIWSKSDKE